MSGEADLPRVEYEDINSGQGTLNKDLASKESAKTGIAFEPGDVLYGKLRPYLMNWLYPQFRGIAVGDFWVLRPDGVEGSFLYRFIQSERFQYNANISSGSKMPRADWAFVSEDNYLVPSSRDEQRLIGTTFQQLDNLITLHQRKHQSTGQTCVKLGNSVSWGSLTLRPGPLALRFMPRITLPMALR